MERIDILDTIQTEIVKVRQDNREPKYLIVNYDTLVSIRNSVHFVPRETLKGAYEALGDMVAGLTILVIKNNNIAYLEVI